MVSPLFRTVLYSWEISSTPVWSRKISWFRQKKILLINLVPKVPNLHIRTKYTLKICVTTVHLLHCITNFFIHLCFWRTNLWWIKEHPSWETSVNIKKFFWFVYTRLHSSSDSSTLVWWLVYTRLVTRLCLWNRSTINTFAL